MTTPANHAEHGLLPVRDLLISEDVNDVIINPDGSVWVEYTSRAHMERADIEFTPGKVDALGAHLAGETSNPLSRDQPIVSGRVTAFGHSLRVQVIAPPVVESGLSLSIRKYVNRVIDLQEFEFLHGQQVNVSTERRKILGEVDRLAKVGQLDSLLETAITHRLNILVSGGTSSGKTTMARALLARVDQRERIVTIEDAIELNPPHANQVGLIADRISGSNRSPARLLESSLRIRPDRLILGEIRGVEALSFLEAINTGHPGSITTIHADTPALALERMALMVMQTGLKLTMADVLTYAEKTIDIIIQMGRNAGQRGVLEIFIPALHLGMSPSR